MVDLVVQERTKMYTMKYQEARKRCNELIEIFNECKAESCDRCILDKITVSDVYGERATACNLLVFYKRYLEDRIAEALK